MSIFVVAQPKSASTHITASIQRYKLWTYAMCNVYANKGVETQDINREMLEPQLKLPNLAWKQHMLPTPNNVIWLKKNEIPVVVTRRNIPDTIVSLFDYFEKLMPDVDTVFSMPIGIPVPKRWWGPRTTEQKMDFLISFYGPWIALFQRGWGELEKELNTYTIDYDEFMANKLEIFHELCSWAGWKWDEARAKKALGHMDMRVNRVRGGRGKEQLTQRQLDDISSLTSRLYADILGTGGE